MRHHPAPHRAYSGIGLLVLLGILVGSAYIMNGPVEAAELVFDMLFPRVEL